MIVHMEICKKVTKEGYNKYSNTSEKTIFKYFLYESSNLFNYQLLIIKTLFNYYILQKYFYKFHFANKNKDNIYNFLN